MSDLAAQLEETTKKGGTVGAYCSNLVHQQTPGSLLAKLTNAGDPSRCVVARCAD